MTGVERQLGYDLYSEVINSLLADLQGIQDMTTVVNSFATLPRQKATQRDECHRKDFLEIDDPFQTYLLLLHSVDFYWSIPHNGIF